LQVGDSIRKTGCSAALISNDLLFGNTSKDGKSFFSGFEQISKQIGSLQVNLGNISSQFTNLAPGSPTMDDALHLLALSKTDTIRLSNNDAAGTDLLLAYPVPINQSTPTGSVPSSFPQVLGSYSSRSGITWAIYSALDALDSTLLSLRTSAVEYNNELANLNSGITEIQNKTSRIMLDIEDTDSTLEQHVS
jgi:flagellin-like hook-associated protein FlgL